MKMNRFICLSAMALFAAACSKEPADVPAGGDTVLKATVSIENSAAVTRSDDPAGDYFMFLPEGSLGNEGKTVCKFVSDGAGNLSVPAGEDAVYWDDIEPDAVKIQTAFYLTNTESLEFAAGTSDDLLWGMRQGWKSQLDFTLGHVMSKLSFVLKDKTLNEDIDFRNAKVIIRTGLYRKAYGLDLETGVVSLGPNAAREKSTVVTWNVINDQNATKIDPGDGLGAAYHAILNLGIVPPQEFDAGTMLEITAGEYVYRLELPAMMRDGQGGETAIRLNQGEHLTIYVALTEETIEFTGTLTDWREEEPGTIDVNRVFNISNWNELSDLMLAVNTGYTFKGMVVRLTKDIYVGGQLSLGNDENPFEGIFDGGDHTIYGLGTDENKNIGGMFGFASGATLQNITIETPLVEVLSDDGLSCVGALADKVENTTIFNCRVVTDDDNVAGKVRSYNGHTGGLVGSALGNTSFINCYSALDVESVGSNLYVGGLAGYCEASVSHCSHSGYVRAENSEYVGGLVGYASHTVANSFVYSNMVYGRSKVGGLIGHLDGQASTSYAECSAVSGSTDRGGLLGSMGFNGYAHHCYWLNSGTYTGIGAAQLDVSCEPFTSSASVVHADKLNYNGTDSGSGVWAVSGLRAIFNE